MIVPIKPTEDGSGGEDVRVEDLLLQISLAFMILMGFLLSREMLRQGALQELVRRADQQIAWFKGSSKSELARKLRLAEEREQKYRLWKAWLELREKHRLFQILVFLEDNAVGIAAIEAHRLTTHPLFETFRDELSRVFLAEPSAGRDRPEPVALEVARLAIVTTAHAGLKLPEPETEIARWLETTAARQLCGFLRTHAPFDEEVASRENLLFLAGEIHKDLAAQRQRAGQVQVLAVAKIAEARAADTWTSGAGATARQALRLVLNELDDELRLLPEVRHLLMDSYEGRRTAMRRARPQS